MFTVLKKYSNIILAAVVVMLLLLYMDGCRKHNADSRRITDLLQYEHVAKQYLAKDGSVVNYNNSIRVTPEDLAAVQDTLLNYIANLQLKIKNVQSSTIITERLILDTLWLPAKFTDCAFDTTLYLTTPNYSFDIRATNTGLVFNKLEFPNRLGVTLTDKRIKWWKAKESIVTVTNSNPYMKTDGISTYVFQNNKKIWKKPLAVATFSAIVGGLITWQVVK